MKTVVCAGDSFTFHCIEEYMAWPYHLDKASFDVHVCAEMGSSNTMIAQNALYQLSKLKEKQDIVLITGWSEHTRFELHYTNDHPLFKDVKQIEKTHDHKVTNFLTDNDTNMSAWLKSTGGYGLWKFNHREIDSLVSDYFSKYHSETKQYIDSLKSILLLQNYCKANSIPFLNFKAWDHDILSGKYPEAQYLEDMVDKSSWWFYNNNQGLREWARSKGDDIPNGMHPHNQYQRMFSNDIIEPFIKGL